MWSKQLCLRCILHWALPRRASSYVRTLQTKRNHCAMLSAPQLNPKHPSLYVTRYHIYHFVTRTNYRPKLSIAVCSLDLHKCTLQDTLQTTRTSKHSSSYNIPRNGSLGDLHQLQKHSPYLHFAHHSAAPLVTLQRPQPTCSHNSNPTPSIFWNHFLTCINYQNAVHTQFCLGHLFHMRRKSYSPIAKSSGLLSIAIL